MEQKIKERLIMSTNSSEFDERQSLYVNLMDVKTKKLDKSLDEIEEEGITHLFVQKTDPLYDRQRIKEKKDTYRAEQRRKKR